MTPLRIEARLRTGYVIRDPWSPAIDGIIAAAVMRERLGDNYYSQGSQDMRPVEGLPLETSRHDAMWWYAASSPLPVGLAGQERRYYHRRFDDQHEDYLARGVGRVLTAAGPYKSTRLSVQRRICLALEWHVIGNRGEITRLLRSIDQIGGRRAAGYGEVADWRVEAGGDAEAARLRRPLPVTYAQETGRSGARMPWGIVPPNWLPENVVECVMP